MTTATTPVAFDPAPENLGIVQSFITEAAILAGQVVCFADAATSRSVLPATSSLGPVIGVALHSQATTGAQVAVAMMGSVVKVMLSTVEGTLDAGHWVMISAVAGCVSEWDPAVAAHDGYGTGVMDTGPFPIGFVLDDIAAGSGTAGGTGQCVITTGVLYTASA